MLKVGQSLMINGRKGDICYLKQYEGHDYANICFGDEKLEFKIYEYFISDQSVRFVEVTDSELLANLIIEFVSESLEEI